MVLGNFEKFEFDGSGLVGLSHCVKGRSKGPVSCVSDSGDLGICLEAVFEKAGQGLDPRAWMGSTKAKQAV